VRLPARTLTASERAERRRNLCAVAASKWPRHQHSISWH